MDPAVGEPTEADWTTRRHALVEVLARQRDLTNPRVLAAMAAVPRHRFVPAALRAHAYDDIALAIGLGQTISQPYVVAAMTQALHLQPNARVLELGTGSGYQTAVLAQLAARVVSVECVAALALRARATLQDVGVTGALLLVGDGSAGYPPMAPYDGIIITAAADRVPPPLWDQLAVGGHLVAPVGPEDEQTLCVWEKRPDGRLLQQDLFPCRFVPLHGAHGRPAR